MKRKLIQTHDKMAKLLHHPNLKDSMTQRGKIIYDHLFDAKNIFDYTTIQEYYD